MTRELNIDKMKLDAARAISGILVERQIHNCYAFYWGATWQDFMDIRKSKLDNLSLEKLHSILGRLTPDSS